MTRLVGIDPGLTGGIVCLDTARRTMLVAPLPVRTEKRPSGKIKSYIDEDALAALVRSWCPDEAWVEDVHVIGGKQGPEERRWDGVVGAFTFGEGKGTIRGVLGALGVPRRWVSPQKWKNLLRASSGPGKAKAVKDLAHRYFPLMAAQLKSSGKAEAALIALFGCLDQGIVFNTTTVVPEQHYGAQKTQRV